MTNSLTNFYASHTGIESWPHEECDPVKSNASELLLWIPSDLTSEVVASELIDLTQISERSAQLCSDNGQIPTVLSAKLKPSAVPAVAPLLQLAAQSHHDSQSDLKSLSAEIATRSSDFPNKAFEGSCQPVADVQVLLQEETERTAEADVENHNLVALRDVEIAILKTSLNQTKEKLSRTKAALAKKSDTGQALQLKLIEFHVACKFLTKQNSALTSDLRSVSTENGRLKRDVRAHVADLNRRSEDIMALSIKLSDRENIHAAEILDREVEIKKMRDQQEDCERDLNDEIHRIMTSRSMRWTLPARIFLNFFRYNLSVLSLARKDGA